MIGIVLGRSWRCAAAIFIPLLLAGVSGCHKPGYEIRRPWSEDSSLKVELVTLAHSTKPAVRVSLGGSSAWEARLGALEPGTVTLYVGSEKAGSVAVRIRTAGLDDARLPVCQIQLPGPEGGWQLCRLQIDRFTPAARLEVSPRKFEAGELFVSSPVLTSRQMTAHPSVFVFLIDTVRADKLMTFNPDIPLGGALDRLARDAIVFERLQSS